MWHNHYGKSELRCRWCQNAAWHRGPKGNPALAEAYADPEYEAKHPPGGRVLLGDDPLNLLKDVTALRALVRQEREARERLLRALVALRGEIAQRDAIIAALTQGGADGARG
jgi:pyruvate-formate lyase-activating enzyme